MRQRRYSLCIVLVGLLVGSATAQTATPDAWRLSRMDDVIQQVILRGQLPGAVVLIGRGGNTVYAKAYGNRAVEPSVEPMTLDTVFDIASLSKPVGCGISIMMLADRGKLKLSDPVAKYIPSFASNGKEHVTIEQLLLHVGGLIPDNPLSDYGSDPQASLEKVYSLKPLKTPGEHFWYSDMGYVVLGKVVEAVDGRPLERFAAEEIFAPLGMKDTTYRPDDAMKTRCAPTEKRNGQWIRGEVHDPRAYALGGVAGHAGVFSTAGDLARFCRMILNGGELDGKRILSKQMMEEAVKPHVLPDGNVRSLLFDIDTPYSSCRGDRFDKGTTFGHTGFTGTMFWMDPASGTYLVFLSNRVHPDGRGDILDLRRRVATLAAEAVLGRSEAPAGASVNEALGPTTQPTGAPAGVLCGVDVLSREGFKLLEGRRVALITNHTGLDRAGKRTIDLLLAAKNVQLVKLFSPEHGLYGQVDEKVGHSVDQKTGLKVYSLYGETRIPTAEMMEGVDTLVFDIQDVGTRFYTYISTMGLCMQAAAKHKARMVVLDRPNPITGLHVDGPIAEKDKLSFIAFGPIPLVHGMTIGELARMFNTEYGINCDLAVVEMRGWRRSMWWDQTGLLWVNPSPNMRNSTQALLYSAVGMLESSNLSVGRGCDQPFEMFGAPWIDGRKLAAALNASKLPGLRFVPIEFTPKSSKHAGKLCQGVYIIVTDRNVVEPVRAGITFACTLKRLFGESFDLPAVGRMLGNGPTLSAITSADDPAKVPAMWEEQLKSFRQVRDKYLMYP